MGNSSKRLKAKLTRRRFIARIAAGLATIQAGSLLPSFGFGSSKSVIGQQALSDRKINEISGEKIILPRPEISGEVSIEQALSHRRSRRKYAQEYFTVRELGQLLWAGQGITGEDQGIKLRAAPSAGALYPMDIYVVLPVGVYSYIVSNHSLERISSKDKRIQLGIAALAQEFIPAAPVNLVITVEYERSMIKYEQRGVRYSIIEAGNISQNIYLQAESLGLVTVAVGAFYDDQVQKVLDLPKRHRPLLIMPVGYPLP